MYAQNSATNQCPILYFCIPMPHSVHHILHFCGPAMSFQREQTPIKYGRDHKRMRKSNFTLVDTMYTFYKDNKLLSQPAIFLFYPIDFRLHHIQPIASRGCTSAHRPEFSGWRIKTLFIRQKKFCSLYLCESLLDDLLHLLPRNVQIVIFSSRILINILKNYWGQKTDKLGSEWHQKSIKFLALYNLLFQS